MYIYITRLASNEIFSPSKKIYREAGWAKDLSAPRYMYLRLMKGVTNSVDVNTNERLFGKVANLKYLETTVRESKLNAWK
jgi:hypothetical protein